MSTYVPSVMRDPLRTYQFRLGLLTPPSSNGTATQATLSGGYVAGVQKLSGLGLSIEANEVWEGGNNLHRYAQPNRVTWEPITLEQGIALDDTLEDWAQRVVEFTKTGRAPKGPVKSNVVVDVWDPLLHPRGKPRQSTGPAATTPAPVDGASTTDSPNGNKHLKRFLIFNAWVSKYTAMPQLDAMASEVALLSVELTHEGFREVDEADLPGELKR